MHDQLLFIIMCQNEIKTKRKWHIDSCSLAPVCVFSWSAKSPPPPPATHQRDFSAISFFSHVTVAGPLVVAILNPALSDRFSVFHLYVLPVPSFTLLRVHAPPPQLPGADPGFLKGGGGSISGADIGFPEGGGGGLRHSQAPPPLGHCPCDVIHIPRGGGVQLWAQC